MHGNRRRYPRLHKSLDLTIQAAGNRWEGKTNGLSLFGVKVTPPAHPVQLARGDQVHLRLPLPDQGPPLSLTASVVRTDPDGLALSFLDLEDEQAQRLQDFVDSLLLQETPEAIAVEEKAVPEKPSVTPSEVTPTEVTPSEVTPSDARSDQGVSQELLRQVGLEGLQFPRDVALSRQWRDFLDRLGQGQADDRPKRR